jgi:signal transduction histidine kinase
MSRFRLPIWSPRLLWKLAGSYLVITLAVVIVYVFIDVELNYRGFRQGLNTAALAARIQEEAPRFAPLLTGATPNLPAAEQLLFRLKLELENRQRGLPQSYYFTLAEFTSEVLSLSLLDAQGREIARTGNAFDETSQKLLAQSIAAPVAQRSVILRDTDGVQLVAASSASQPAYALALRLQLPARWWEGVVFASIVGELRTVDLFFMAIMSFVFGSIIARQLTKRLERISTAAEAWGRGDFTALAEDNSADEIGELSRRLNRMAEELREVVALRQNLAASEERNRLARDLHDTVKQRAFALSMQIAATQALMETSPTAATTRLAEAEKLAHQIQQELVTIIDELRPQSSTAKTLPATMRETLNDWSRQTNIPTEFRADGVPSLPETAQAEWLRILQEALSNIARHSGAKTVAVQIHSTDNGHVRMTIRDNGRGFDPAQRNGGMGLRNMRERAEALPGGQFTLTSSPQDGTRIQVRCAKAT